MKKKKRKSTVMRRASIQMKVTDRTLGPTMWVTWLSLRVRDNGAAAVKVRRGPLLVGGPRAFPRAASAADFRHDYYYCCYTIISVGPFDENMEVTARDS